MRWSIRRKRQEEPVAVTRSIADPALAVLFGGNPLGTNLSVNEYSILGNSAFYRAVMLISGTLASLPLRSYRTSSEGQPEKVKSIFDDPDGPDGQTPYEWKQSLFIHILLHGWGGALKVKTEAGALARLALLHPLSVCVEEPTMDEYANPSTLPPGNKWFIVTLNDGKQVKLTSNEIWEVPGPSLDGIKGLGLIQLARQSIATTLAGDKAAFKLFDKGALISGLATPADDEAFDPTDDITQLRRELNNEMMGADNAGGIALVNRRLKFTPWTMSAVDAQFIQSRQFQTEEVSRWTGVPPHLLMQTEKQTSWGQGVAEQNVGLGRFVLNPWATSFEQRGSRLLANPRWVEFDFSGLERPTPEKEIDLLLKQTGGKPILTVNEARAIRNLPPVPGGDVLLDRESSTKPSEKEEEVVPDDPDAQESE